MGFYIFRSLGLIHIPVSKIIKKIAKDRGYIDNIKSVCVSFVDVKDIVSVYKENILHKRNVKKKNELKRLDRHVALCAFY